MLLILCGASCTGKSTLAHMAILDGWKPYKTATTRPKRFPSEEEYIFKTDAEFEDCDFIESRTYSVEGGVWKYGTPKIDINNDDYVIILDVEGAKKVIDYYGVDNCLCVGILCDDVERCSRAYSRPGFDKKEWRRREKADFVDFSYEKMSEVCNAFVSNTYDDPEYAYGDIMLIVGAFKTMVKEKGISYYFNVAYDDTVDELGVDVIEKK